MEDAIWDVMTSLEECTDMRSFSHGAEVFGKRETKNGSKAAEFDKIQTLEEGSIPAKEAKNWRIEREKKRITRGACYGGGL